MPLAPRNFEVPIVTQGDLESLTQQLGMFYDKYRRAAGDVSRFEMLLDEMFEVFVQKRGKAADEASGPQAWPLLPSADNLDTGNARHLPYAGFVAGLKGAVSDLNAYRAYVGPRPIQGLPELVLDWLVRCGVVEQHEIASLGVAIGCGTVNLYDALARKLVRRPGDMVVFPPVSYGFFVPQVERTGGRVIVLEQRRWWIDPERYITGFVDRLEKVSTARWKRCLSERLRLYAQGVLDHTGGTTAKFERAAHQLMVRLESEDNPRGIDEAIAKLAIDTLFNGDREAFLDLQCRPELRFAGPPRAVGFFFTNPDTFGRTYPSSETLHLADVLGARQIALVEDWAYHSLGAPPKSLGSVVGCPSEVYLLLGLSKPLAIADCRVGLMVAKKAHLKPIYRIIENTIGFVSTRIQSALKHVFETPDELNTFLDNVWASPDGYEGLRDLAIACFGGCCSSHLDPIAKAECRQRLNAFVHRRFPNLSTSTAHTFVEHGLSRWFTIPEKPTAGFFLVVDCSPFLDRPPAALCHLIRTSFDVFATLSVLFGVRSIPEECMGDLDFARGRHIRFTFSVDPEFLMACALTMHLGLIQLDTRSETAHRSSSTP